MNKQQEALVVTPLIGATVNLIKANEALVELYAAHGLIAWEDVRHTVAASIQVAYKCTMHESERKDERGLKDYTSSNHSAKMQFIRIKALFTEPAPSKGKGKSNETDPVAHAIKVCAKLSWAEWNKVVKAIEATR